MGLKGERRHIKLLPIKLFSVTLVTGLPSRPGRVPGRKDFYVPWVPKIAHKSSLSLFSLVFLLAKTKENAKNTKDFLLLPNPGNPVKRRGKPSKGVSKPGGFPLFFGKVQIVSRTLSGLFLVGAVIIGRQRGKGTNRENSRTIPEQIGKIPEKSGVPKRTKKDKKGQKRTKKSRLGSPPV